MAKVYADPTNEGEFQRMVAFGFALMSTFAIGMWLFGKLLKRGGKR